MRRLVIISGRLKKIANLDFCHFVVRKVVKKVVWMFDVVILGR
jgi:hypothetical protein